MKKTSNQKKKDIKNPLLDEQSQIAARTSTSPGHYKIDINGDIGIGTAAMLLAVVVVYAEGRKGG